MKILWVNYMAIPKIAKALNAKATPVGGWMVKLADEISSKEDLKLFITFPNSSNVKGSVDNIDFAGFIENDLDYFKSIIKEFRPDVVQVFGTEGVHSATAVKACEELGILDKVAVSIQGLLSVYAKHYTGYLPPKVIKGWTLRDLYKGNVARKQKEFERLGQLEIDVLKKVKHIIGRTTWDRVTTSQINPQATYHFNNEMLRDAFYNNSWDINKCRRHSIFSSQAHYPIKGIHLVIEAIGILKDKYPDIKLFIAGKSYTAKASYKLSYYEKYVIGLIKKFGLENNVEFTGFLDEEKMCKQYLNSHVFVSASSIENSPNSVCEAMILGMPTISSLVGGVADLMTLGLDGLYYQADAPYMLADCIDKVFSSDELAVSLGNNARITASKRHDVADIISDLMNIYKEISKD